ncbi:MAG: hypothetical protein HGA80_09675 [Candidatus Omnitrophica bacterium]|nr:hypothetical protein [Candidatus Omnitrophota bacterium]
MASIVQMIGQEENYKVRRGNLKGKVLDYNYFADRPDYTDEEWERIKALYLRSSQIVE